MDHVPQHCEKLAEQIATETDEAEREVLRAAFREQCQGDAARSSTTSDDSGGGGAGDPPRPPKKPPIVE